ncbi:MAG: hypothetical protein PUD53_03015 [Oscillospiraceae bacterium]|nr:hypothetical protein [Oscillospiraceae bacterium]
MKKVLVILCLSMVTLFAFTGCNGNDIVEAEETMVSDILNPTDDSNNGNVSDSNGIIGDENETESSTNASTKSSSSENNKTRTAISNTNDSNNNTTNSTDTPIV